MSTKGNEAKKQPQNKAAKTTPRTVEDGSALAEIPLEVIGILDAFPNYIMLVDANHHIILANKAVNDALGVAPRDIIGKYCPKVIHQLDGPFPGCPLEDAVKTGQATKKQLFDPKFGRWVETAIYPTKYRTQDGHIIYLHTSTDITDEKENIEALTHNYDTQQVLNTLLGFSLEQEPIGDILKRALNLVLSISWLTLEAKGCIFLIEDDSDVLVMKVQSKLAEPIQKACARVPFGKCLCGRAALTQEIQFADCIDDRHETQYLGIIPHGHYCVPILYAGKTLGVINSYIKEGHDDKPEERGFLTALANTLAGIIVREQADKKLEQGVVKLQQTFESAVDALAFIRGIRDPYTAGHQTRVTKLACAIAEEMGLSQDRLELIKIAGILHDIGKMHVPAEILSKPGKLTEIEFRMIKNHPQVGYDIVKKIEFPCLVANIVLQHHERLDGSGYPQGLRGENTILEAKILAVADVVEAMASHRPYRPALGIDKALEEISQKKGTFYDPVVVDACIKLFTEKGFRFE